MRPFYGEEPATETYIPAATAYFGQEPHGLRARYIGTTEEHYSAQAAHFYRSEPR